MEKQYDLFEQILQKSKEALLKKEVPISCLIYDPLKNSILSINHNLTNLTKNATKHCEILCLEECLQNQDDLSSYEAYVTVEPCLMCGYALVLANIKKVYYLIPNEKFGGVESLYSLELNCEKIDYKGNEVIDMLKQFYNQGNEKLAPEMRHRYKKTNQFLIIMQRKTKQKITTEKTSVSKKSNNSPRQTSTSLNQKKLKKYNPIDSSKVIKSFKNQSFSEQIFSHLQIAYQNKDYPQSISLCNSLLTEESNNVFLYYIRGNSKMFIGEYQSAIEDYDIVLKRDSSYNSKVYLFLSICYQNLKQYKQAIILLNSGITIFPQNEEILVSQKGNQRKNAFIDQEIFRGEKSFSKIDLNELLRNVFLVFIKMLY